MEANHSLISPSSLSMTDSGGVKAISSSCSLCIYFYFLRWGSSVERWCCGYSTWLVLLSFPKWFEANHFMPLCFLSFSPVQNVFSPERHLKLEVIDFSDFRTGCAVKVFESNWKYDKQWSESSEILELYMCSFNYCVQRSNKGSTFSLHSVINIEH